MRLGQPKNIAPDRSTPTSPFFNKESKHSFLGDQVPFFPKLDVQAKTEGDEIENRDQKEENFSDNLVQSLSIPVSDGGRNTNKVTIQRKCTDCEKEDEKVQMKESTSLQLKENVAAGDPPPTPATQPSPALATAAATTHVVVEDNEQAESGQMRKTAFLERLKTEVCESVDSALAGTPFSSDKCPYIRASFERHQNSSATQIEALINRYCPTSAPVKTAEELIQHMKAKVFTSALQWAKSGGDLSGVSQVFGPAIGALSKGIGNIASAVGSLFFKAEPGGAHTSQTPHAVKESLGKGTPIDGTTKSKMESAFGTSFSNVEIHNDNNASKLSSDMNARAFTVGNHIAFASGEHKPGTLIGDALMAHELAHTIQQSDSPGSETNIKSGIAYHSLEEDADNAAVGAVSSIFGLSPELSKEKKPVLKSKLKLQRCTGSKCPDGFSWQVVNRACAAAGGDCTWACVPFASSGPSISDPYAPRPSMPSQKHTLGICTGGLPDVYISCLPLKDEDGNIIGTDNRIGAEPNQDYTGALAGAGHMAEQKGANQPAPTTDSKSKGAVVEPVKPVTPEPAKPVTPEPVKPVTPEPVKPVTPEPAKPVTPEPVKPVTPEPVKPVTPEPAKPVTPEPVKPGTAEPATPGTSGPIKPTPLAAGESLTVPYKGGKARATVLEVGPEFVKIKVKSKSSSGDITQSIPKAKFEELKASGQIIRWTEERASLMKTRPPYAEGLVDTVWEKAVKASPDGIVRDPNTKEVLKWDKNAGRFDQWHMGHIKGAKYSDLVDSYVDGKISWEEFISEYNSPANYRPESPKENMSHAWE